MELVMGVSDCEMEKFLVGWVNVDVKIGLFHVKSHKPGTLGERRDNHGECHHPEPEFPDESVEYPKVQNRTVSASFFWNEEIWGIKTVSPIRKGDMLYGALEEEVMHFLSEEVSMGGISRVSVGWTIWGGIRGILWSTRDG